MTKSLNLLDQANPASTKKKPKSNKKKSAKKMPGWLRTSLIVLIALILAIGIFGLINVGNAKELYGKAMAGKEDFLKAQEAIYTQDFGLASEHLLSARNNFADAHSSLKKMKVFKYLPLVGRQYVAVDNILVVGTQLSSAVYKISNIADDIFQALKDEEEVSFASLSEEKKELILEKISESPEVFKTAQSEIDIAQSAIEQIPEKGLLGPIKDATDPIKEQFPLLKKIIDTTVPAAESLPAILGWPNEKTYLFLLQNNTELRPTGGFIGTFGILKVENAEIRQFTTDNIYNLDNPVKNTLFLDPPEPIQKYLSQTQWFMRDSNWDPDFPTSAEKALWFYQEESGSNEDFYGVIAVTPTFIQSLLEITGEITVDGVAFNSENLIEVLEFQVEKGFMQAGIPLSERKEIIGSLANELMDRILNLPKNRWGELWKTFYDDVVQKQILIYIKDDHTQELVKEEQWAGEVKDFVGDYIFVVDSNMASLKSDPGVAHQIDYTLTKNENNELISNLAITYDNQGAFDWKTTRYRTYVRVLVPYGSELIDWEGAMENDKLLSKKEGGIDVSESHGRTQFGAFISIEPKEKKTLSFTYKLPVSFGEFTDQNKEYGLYVQKQAGTIGHGLNIVLDLDKRLDSIKPTDTVFTTDLSSLGDLGTAYTENALKIESSLLTDQQFTVYFK